MVCPARPYLSCLARAASSSVLCLVPAVESLESTLPIPGSSLNLTQEPPVSQAYSAIISHLYKSSIRLSPSVERAVSLRFRQVVSGLALLFATPPWLDRIARSSPRVSFHDFARQIGALQRFILQIFVTAFPKVWSLTFCYQCQPTTCRVRKCRPRLQPRGAMPKV